MFEGELRFSALFKSILDVLVHERHVVWTLSFFFELFEDLVIRINLVTAFNVIFLFFAEQLDFSFSDHF